MPLHCIRAADVLYIRSVCFVLAVCVCCVHTYWAFVVFGTHAHHGTIHVFHILCEMWMVEMKRKTNFTDISIIQWNRFFFAGIRFVLLLLLSLLKSAVWLPIHANAGWDFFAMCVCAVYEHRMYHMSVLYMHASIANIWKQRVPAYNRCVHFSVEINKHYCASYVVCIWK